MSKVKTTYRHVTESGQVATRQTAREYQYVMVVERDVEAEVAYCKASMAATTHDPGWYIDRIAYMSDPTNLHAVVSWHMTREAAEKALVSNSAKGRAKRHNTRRAYVESINGGTR
jgi:hypothetical protein